MCEKEYEPKCESKGLCRYSQNVSLNLLTTESQKNKWLLSAQLLSFKVLLLMFINVHLQITPPWLLASTQFQYIPKSKMFSTFTPTERLHSPRVRAFPCFLSLTCLGEFGGVKTFNSISISSSEKRCFYFIAVTTLCYFRLPLRQALRLQKLLNNNCLYSALEETFLD